MAASPHGELLFEKNPLPMWVFDLDTLAFLAVNEAAIAKYGYSRDEFLHMTSKNLRPLEDVSAFLKEARKPGCGLREAGTWRHLRKDGTLIEVEITDQDIEWNGRHAKLVVANEITERKRAERSLRAERELLRAVIDNMPDYIYVKDAESRFVLANRALAGLVGAKTPEDLLGKTDFDFFPKQLAAAFFSDEQALIRSGKPLVNQEEASMDASGNPKWTSTSKVPLRDEHGQVMRIVGIGRDITSHKRAENALRETIQELKALVEACPAGIVCLDRAGNVTTWNPAAERIFGWNEKELLGRPLPMVPEDRRKQYSELRALALKGETVLAREVRAQKRDGSAILASVSMAPLRDATGEIRGTMDMALDITSRKQAEGQLLLQATALESAANAVVITDSAGKLLWLNSAFTALTGFSIEEATGQTFNILNSGEHPKSFFREMWNTILGGQIWHGEVVNRRKDGTIFTVEQTITPVRSERGDVARFVTIMQDVTERKNLEQQLNQAQKMESVGRLAGGVAHDFNNLLSIIIGYSEILMERPGFDSQALRLAEEIKRAGARAATLTRQLLAFSRQQVLEPRVLNLNTIVTDTQKMLRRLIGEDVEIQTKLEGDLGRVKADPGQIDQILINLAVNARDAMPTGGKLTIETSNVELDEDYAAHHPPATPGRYVLLAMADTGMGMNREIKARIFEPFFTTKELGKGTGLGLSTVYGIVKQSGGYIWVYSEPGQGSVFKIYLPRVDQPVEPILPAEPAAESLRGTETILVVEDEDTLRTLIRTVLEQSGYTVMEAKSGADALKAVQEHDATIQLLLTDVIMPGMSGPAVAEQLVHAHPKTRVLYMSGYADSYANDRGLLAKGAVLIQKPFTREALLRKVREVLGRSAEGPIT
jgi:two-component system, cell cycle sensor histidine kinase and response regulator CckA